MKKLILRNVPLDTLVKEYVKDKFEVISVDELNDENAKEIEVLLTSGVGKAPKSLLDRLPNLKLIDDFGVGYDGIDIKECARRDITVCNTPNVLTEDVADLAIALLFALYRHIPEANRQVKNGDWENKSLRLGLGRKVSGKKVGIVGLGRIGKAVAQRMSAFNCPIFYSSRKEHSDAQALGYQYEKSIVDLAQKVDVLIVCAAATQENAGLISREVLSALGPDGVIINIARGILIDEAAMIELLKDGKLGGAGLDVFAQEPHVPDALKHMDNVVLTPHIASATNETRAQMAELVIANLKAFYEGDNYLTALDLSELKD